MISKFGYCKVSWVNHEKIGAATFKWSKLRMEFGPLWIVCRFLTTSRNIILGNFCNFPPYIPMKLERRFSNFDEKYMYEFNKRQQTHLLKLHEHTISNLVIIWWYMYGFLFWLCSSVIDCFVCCQSKIAPGDWSLNLENYLWFY